MGTRQHDMTTTPLHHADTRFWYASNATVQDFRSIRRKRPLWSIAWRLVQETQRRHAIQNELARLSDRELADIGLHRGMIPYLFRKSGAD